MKRQGTYIFQIPLEVSRSVLLFVVLSKLQNHFSFLIIPGMKKQNTVSSDESN